MKDILNKIYSGPLEDFVNRLIQFIPNLFIAIVLLILGFIVGWFMKITVARILRLINADRFLQKVGISHAFEKSGVRDMPSHFIARVSNWLVIIIFLTISLNALQIPAIENLLEQFFLYIPDFFIAVAIIVAGYWIGDFVGEAVLIALVNAGFSFAGLLSKGVKLSIFMLTFTMALEQLGIGRDTVLIAFTLIFGGIIFALSLSFGLAGKDVALDYLKKALKEKDKEDKEEDDIQHI